MSKMYEMKRVETDPFCIMCGEGPMDDIEWWEPTTEEELREMHSYLLIEDKSTPDDMREAMSEDFGWQPTPEDFDEWLKQCIDEGDVREADTEY